MFWREIAAELRNKLVTPEKLAFYLSKFIDVVLLVTAASLLYLLARALTRRVLKKTHARRAATYVNVVHSIIGYVIFFLALVLVLRVFGVNYTAILAGAGVVGLAVGFGAQTLIRDFISGFFLLLEDLVSVGDWISVGDISGLVETIGLRVTRLRGFDGTLHVVPNGELTRFGNANRGFMRALITVDIAYEQDPSRGMALAKSVAEQWYVEHHETALEPPVVQGLLSFDESGLRIRIVCKVKPMQHWQAERDLRLRLKQAFDAGGVEVPFPRRVVYIRAGADPGSTPGKPTEEPQSPTLTRKDVVPRASMNPETK